MGKPSSNLRVSSLSKSTCLFVVRKPVDTSRCLYVETHQDPCKTWTTGNEHTWCGPNRFLTERTAVGISACHVFCLQFALSLCLWTTCSKSLFHRQWWHVLQTVIFSRQVWELGCSTTRDWKQKKACYIEIIIGLADYDRRTLESGRAQ